MLGDNQIKQNAVAMVMVKPGAVSIAIMQYRISIFSPRNVGSGRGQLQQNLSRESGAEQQRAMPETKIRGVEKLGSPSKSESLVKDDSRLAAKKQQVFTSSRS